MELSDPIHITRQVTEVLEKLGIRYLVGGSLASSLHGIPRATQDVDIVAELHEKDLAGLEHALAQQFFFDGEMARKAIREQSSFNIIDKEELFKVDIFVRKSDRAAGEEMDRRVLHQIAGTPGQSMYICSAEDIVAHKLFWFQLGEGVSDRQWHDALNVLKVQKQRLDMEYLKKACRGKGVTGLLQKALNEAES